VKVKTHKAFVRRNVFFTTVSVNQTLTDILIAKRHRGEFPDFNFLL